MTTPTRGQVVIKILLLNMAYMCTKFDDGSFSHSGVMIGGNEIYNWSHDCNHAHMRDSLSSQG